MATLFQSFRSISRRFTLLRIRASVIGLLAFLCFSAIFAGAQTIPTDAKPAAGDDCSVSTTMFNSFFHGGTAAVDGVVDPANSVTFTNNTALHNCDFYQWAQQMFLWLTSPAPPSYGGGGGRIFASPQFYTVSPADSGGKRTLIANPSSGPLKFINVRPPR
jgi:hypothetical protein